jgi:Na+/proline symporter
LAIELKKRAPNAHTFLEIVYARYGKATHIIYLCFALATNIVRSAVFFVFFGSSKKIALILIVLNQVVSAMLLLGGSAVVSYLTDMNVIAACFLLPLGVIGM